MPCGGWVPSPTVGALEKLVRGISERVGRVLERQGLLVRDFENSSLTLDSADVSGFDDLLGHSITYRIALGPHQGHKVFTLRTVPSVVAVDDNSSAAKAAGFSLQARHVSMTWAQRLKRVFRIDILTCEHCGGAVKVLASAEAPVVIKKILDHLARRAEATTPVFRLFARAPP